MRLHHPRLCRSEWTAAVAIGLLVAIVVPATYAEVYWRPEAILDNTTPAHVLLGHWENFFLPPRPWGDSFYEKAMVCRAEENTIYFASVNTAMRFQNSWNSICVRTHPNDRISLLIIYALKRTLSRPEQRRPNER